MKASNRRRSLLDMLLPWKIGTALSNWIIVLLLLPRNLPTIDRGYWTLFMTNTPSTTATTVSSSSVVMVVDAEKVANPTDQFDIDDSFLRVTIRHQTFHEIPSCQHRITQIELHNLVAYTFHVVGVPYCTFGKSCWSCCRVSYLNLCLLRLYHSACEIAYRKGLSHQFNSDDGWSD